MIIYQARLFSSLTEIPPIPRIHLRHIYWSPAFLHQEETTLADVVLEFENPSSIISQALTICDIISRDMCDSKIPKAEEREVSKWSVSCVLQLSTEMGQIYQYSD